MKNFLHFMLPLSVMALALFAISCSPKPSRLTRIMVAGEADSKAQPDTAVIIISVITQNAQALNAQQENARKSDAVIHAVQATAGANPEIKTSDYSLQPQETYNDSRMPRIIGYEARNSVTVTMSELNNVGAVIDAASKAGANSIDRVSFILRENNPARSQSLAEATRQAMSKAQSIAEALGGRIVRVVEEQEGGANRPPLNSYENDGMSTNTNTAGLANRVSIPTPVQTGPLNIKSQVQLVVEVEAPAGSH